MNPIGKCEKIPEPLAKEYFAQIISGLEHCLELNIVHRDLKPENILLTTDGVLKISGTLSMEIGIDFGFSVMASFDEAKLLHTTCGTLNYIAPEVIKNAGYDGHKADVWSCGVILYYMLAGSIRLS